jgi:cyclophilin family peptidyl-prolyl cis-trans isomerase
MNHHSLQARRLALSTFGFALAALVAACGGGGSSPSTIRVASVSAITADTAPSYDNLATFTVAGTDLDAGVTATATGCTGAAVLSGGTSTSVKVSCTPSRDGDISLSVSATGGAMLKTVSFTVPKPQVRMTTSLGSLLIELEPAKAPITVKNFLAYVQDGFYVNTVFHRIISTFMAQGGGFTFGTNYSAKTPTRPAITLEKTSATGLSNTAKTIAMARTSIADSATSQFFINLVDNAFLNAQGSSDGNGYAVFGTVVTTTDVNSDVTLAALKAVQVLNNGAGEVSLPTNPPVVSAISRVR